MYKLSFLIVNYYAFSFIKELIVSIKNNINKFSFEILIYDNSCNSVELKKLKSLESENVIVYSSIVNIGFVKANNFLYEKSSNEIIILLNPDVLLLDNSLEKLFDFLEESENIGVIGPKLLNGDLTYQVSFYKFPNLMSIFKEHLLFYKSDPYVYNTSNNLMQTCDVIKGACMVMKRSTVIELGLFDESFIMYSEDVDLCKKYKVNKYENIYYPTAQLVHYGKQSSSQKHISEYSLFHYNRSKIIYFNKYFSSLRYVVGKVAIIFSLLEKSLLFFLMGRREDSKTHIAVFKKLIFKKLIGDARE